MDFAMHGMCVFSIKCREKSLPRNRENFPDVKNSRNYQKQKKKVYHRNKPHSLAEDTKYKIRIKRKRFHIKISDYKVF